MRIFHKVGLAASAVAVLSLAGYGIASASIPSADGVFYGCVKGPSSSSPGELIVKDDGGTGNITCGSDATKITWNQAGPAGPAGPAATAQEVTNQVTYNIGGSGPVTEQATIDCPSGTLAINGGVQSEEPGTPDPGFTVSQNGAAVEVFDPASNGNALPRPVSSGANWELRADITSALETGGGTQQPMPTLVTYYAICE